MSQWQLNNGLYIIAYDITSDKIRDKVARCLELYGIREQYSLFKCNLSHRQFEQISSYINEIIDTQTDSVIYYPMCNSCAQNIVSFGITNPRKREELILL